MKLLRWTLFGALVALLLALCVSYGPGELAGSAGALLGHAGEKAALGARVLARTGAQMLETGAESFGAAVDAVREGEAVEWARLRGQRLSEATRKRAQELIRNVRPTQLSPRETDES